MRRTLVPLVTAALLLVQGMRFIVIGLAAFVLVGCGGSGEQGLRLPSGRSLDDYPGIVNQIEKRVEPSQTHKGDDFADNEWSTCVMDGVVEHFCVYEIPGDWAPYELDCGADTAYMVRRTLEDRRVS
jgi:hypothetical protein